MLKSLFHSQGRVLGAMQGVPCLQLPNIRDKLAVDASKYFLSYTITAIKFLFNISNKD